MTLNFNVQIFTEGSVDVPKDYVKAMQYFEKAADQVSGHVCIPNLDALPDTRTMETAIVG